jgi:hypothetical protein
MVLCSLSKNQKQQQQHPERLTPPTHHPRIPITNTTHTHSTHIVYRYKHTAAARHGEDPEDTYLSTPGKYKK